MTGSMAARRLISRLMAGVMRRFAGGVDPEPVAQRGIVTAISGIDQNALELGPDHRIHVGNDLCQGVAVISVAGQRLGMDWADSNLA
jgi:hypothetical protein